MKNIVLIGNGFDLSHDLKTKYSQFLDSIDENSFKKEITYIYKGNENIEDGTPAFTQTKANSIYNEIIETKHELWCDIEAVYFKMLMQSEYPQLLNQEFNEIKTRLQEYLVEESKKAVRIESYAEIFKSFRYKPVIVSFNYTKTAELYSDSYNELLYLHGQLNNEQNPIIFGYSANNADTQTLLDKRQDEFLKNIKQYEYLGANNFQRIRTILDKSTKVNVILIGLSCGLSDSLILKEILAHENVQYIFNFYYKNRSSHLSTLMNINRIIGEQEGFKKFMPMPNCLRMPQTDKLTTNEEIARFNELNKAYGL